MKKFRVEGYSERLSQLEGWPIRVASYKLGDRFVSRVDNVSPGATIARGEGQDRNQAEAQALEKAAGHLRNTRRYALSSSQKKEH
jgi:hypothetical protein